MDGGVLTRQHPSRAPRNCSQDLWVTWTSGSTKPIRIDLYRVGQIGSAYTFIYVWRNWIGTESKQARGKTSPRERDIPVLSSRSRICSDRPFDQRHRACNYELINNVLAHFSRPQPARQAIDTIAIISILSSLACLHIFGALSEECRDTVWLRWPNIPISQCFSFFLTHLLKLKNIVLKSFCECSIKIS